MWTWCWPTPPIRSRRSPPPPTSHFWAPPSPALASPWAWVAGGQGIGRQHLRHLKPGPTLDQQAAISRLFPTRRALGLSAPSAQLRVSRWRPSRAIWRWRLHTCTQCAFIEKHRRPLALFDLPATARCDLYHTNNTAANNTEPSPMWSSPPGIARGMRRVWHLLRLRRSTLSISYEELGPYHGEMAVRSTHRQKWTCQASNPVRQPPRCTTPRTVRRWASRSARQLSARE